MDSSALNDCTCVIASHIASEDRLYWLCEAVDSATRFFPALLSVSCTEELYEIVEREIQSFACIVYCTTEQRTQFEHIAEVAAEITTSYVIFLDDDDLFLDSVEETWSDERNDERKSQRSRALALRGRGVQEIHYTGCNDVEGILCDFSGTFCPTSFLLDFLVEYEDELETYDCDCLFRSLTTKYGKGALPNDSVYYHNMDIDHDVIPFVYRREHTSSVTGANNNYNCNYHSSREATQFVISSSARVASSSASFAKGRPSSSNFSVKYRMYSGE